MKIRIVATSVALGLAFAALTPVAANAADLTVTGTVTLAGTAPAAGVEVGWYDPATRESGESTTAPDGSYTLLIPDTHSYVLYAGINRDEGSWKSVGGDIYVGKFAGNGKQDYLFQGLPLFTGTPASAAIDLDRPGSITGATPGVKSVSFLSGGHDLIRTVKPDATTGAYAVTGLIPGTYYAEADPADTSKDRFVSGPITVTAGAPTVFTPDFSVRSTGTVTGVITSGGKPVKNVSVTISNNASGGSDKTDSKGRYSISKLTAGKYDVFFGFGGDGDAPGAYRPVNTTVTVAVAKKSTLNQSIQKGGTISGSVVRPGKSGYFKVIVVDAKNRIVGGHSFLFDKKKSSTSFTLKGVKKGDNRRVVIVNDAGKKYASKTVDVDASVAVGSFTLSKKTLTISGTVKGAKTGLISYGFGKSGGDFIGYLHGSTATIKNGKYTVTGVLPGRATLTTVVDDTKPRDATLTVTRSTKKTLTVGAKYTFPTVTGTLLVDGRPLPFGNLSFGKDDRDYGEGGSASIVNGVITESTIVPDRTWIARLDTTSDIKEFQTNSPFYLSIPASINRVKLAANTTKDFGTVQLQVNR